MAKTLYLVRHAKSSWSNAGLSDFDRPLNKRGLRDAPEMGRRLRERNAQPEIILCSPAQRTRETVALLIKAMGLTENIVQFDERIYEASTHTLLQVIQSLPGTCSSAMLIGHNPAIGWLANELSGRRIDRMPTCATASIQADTGYWSAIGRCTTRLLDFDYPKRRCKDEPL